MKHFISIEELDNGYCVSFEYENDGTKRFCTKTKGELIRSVRDYLEDKEVFAPKKKVDAVSTESSES
jgi:hypothetical protein